MTAETRFQATAQYDQERYQALVARASEQIRRRWTLYEALAATADNPAREFRPTHGIPAATLERCGNQ